MEKLVLQITYYLLTKDWLDDKDKLYENLRQYDKKKVVVYLSFTITILVYLFGHMLEKLLKRYRITTKKCKVDLYEILFEVIIGPIIEETGKKIATKLGYGKEFVIYDSIIEWILQHRYEAVNDIREIFNYIKMKHSKIWRFFTPDPKDYLNYIVKNIMFKKYFMRLMYITGMHYTYYKFHEKGMHNFAVFVHVAHNMLITYIYKCLFKLNS